MDNFRTLVMKFTGRLLPAHQSLVERRFDDNFPDVVVPDHAPYADMILTALWELNTEGGSSEEAISDFIKKEYHELPWAHATMLSHHLRDLCMKGKITMTRDRCYLRCSSITKPILNPSPCSSPSSSPISSPYSSSSDSLCSSPSSSSSSSCWGTPYKRGSKRKRKVKNIKRRVRRPRMIQVGQRGMIRTKRQGRQSKEVKIGETSQMEEEHMDVIGKDEDLNKLEVSAHVTEDQNEVTGMEVEDDAIQDRDVYNVITSNNLQGQEDGAEKQQNHPHEKNSTDVETGQKVGEKWNGNVKEKEESVGLRRSGRRRNDVSKEENLHKVGVKEQYRPQKQYNFRWIGRGEHTQVKGECVKQRGSGSKHHVDKEQDQPWEQQLEEGIKEQGHQRKQCNVVWIGRGVRKLKEADDEVTELEDGVSEEEDAEHGEGLKKNKENHQSDMVEKQILEKEQLMSVPNDKLPPCERHERVDMESELEVAEKLSMARSDTQQEGVITESNGKQKQVDEENMEQVDLQKPSKEETDDKIHIQGKQMADEQCEAQVMVASEEIQHDDTVEEQLKEDTKEEFQTREPQKSGDTEQEILEKQVEMVGTPLQDEYEAQEKTEPDEQHDYLTKERFKEWHNDVSQEHIHPLEQCVVTIEEKLLSQKEEQQIEVNLKEIGVVVDTEVQQDSLMKVEQRRPLRQGLRSGCKKEEATSNTKNQLEQVSPTRRSLRHRKITPEAAVITEGPDHSKDQQSYSGRLTRSKRKTIAEAEQVSKSHKTRRTYL